MWRGGAGDPPRRLERFSTTQPPCGRSCLEASRGRDLGEPVSNFHELGFRLFERSAKRLNGGIWMGLDHFFREPVKLLWWPLEQ
jgi:hypothetical protein